MNANRSKLRSQQDGLSLLEVLIAVVILAIGLLGIASTQLLALEQTTNSHVRSQATMYAMDVASRVRANGGDMISSGEITTMENRMQKEMGSDASLNTNMNGNMLEVTVNWTERDRFAESGESDQSFTLKARMGNG
ncbi:type IV pilus assembly protein PilV [Halospina denitrificans]|uniref:Type IV pilus assembly protein PilV n=1 Tax=Halospina denitrificans TaxID=332522 RepID=A0A4R7JH29_9GAMM|nr:type IV pilus modification protein PilV [Halospina denitrificans]TDT37122.1 type IV pilus assembly protein PilV [Halospina denitrificans]